MAAPSNSQDDARQVLWNVTQGNVNSEFSGFAVLLVIGKWLSNRLAPTCPELAFTSSMDLIRVK
jgi:hypothetical protein